MSTRDEVVVRIQRLLGFRTDKVTVIREELQLAQAFYEDGGGLDLMPWFLESEYSSANTTIGEERLAVPADFIREHEDGTLFLFNSSAEAADQWIDLPKSDLDALKIKFGGSQNTPCFYALVGDYFRLFPIPDKIYAIKMIFYQKEPILDSDIENDWLKYAEELISGHAGAKVAFALRDKNAEAMFEKMEGRALQQVIKATEARHHENQEYVMGGDD